MNILEFYIDKEKRELINKIGSAKYISEEQKEAMIAEFGMHAPGRAQARDDREERERTERRKVAKKAREIEKREDEKKRLERIKKEKEREREEKEEDRRKERARQDRAAKMKPGDAWAAAHGHQAAHGR